MSPLRPDTRSVDEPNQGDSSLTVRSKLVTMTPRVHPKLNFIITCGSPVHFWWWHEYWLDYCRCRNTKRYFGLGWDHPPPEDRSWDEVFEEHSRTMLENYSLSRMAPPVETHYSSVKETGKRVGGGPDLFPDVPMSKWMVLNLDKNAKSAVTLPSQGSLTSATPPR